MQMNVMKLRQDFTSASKLAPEYASLVESVCGKNSAEYIDVKKEQANTYFNMSSLNAAYKEILEAYEMAKQLYGSEKNKDAVEILWFMWIIKIKFKQFDKARNIITKAKEIEEQLSSKFSQKYKVVVSYEKKLNEEEAKLKKYKRIKDKNHGFISKIIPNTPTKFAIFWTVIAAAAVGVAYLIKKK